MNSRRLLAALACAAIVSLAGCGDSNDVTSPGTMAASANVAGTWTGDFHSNTPSLCTGTAATVTLTQQGSRVMGTFEALGCGIRGSFNGSVDGPRLTGKVDMLGCTGGSATGRMTDPELQMTIGDFKKELITGDRELLAGGTVTFRR